MLRSLKNTYRCLANETAAEVARLESAGQSDYAVLGPLVGGPIQKVAYETGDWTKGVLSLGPAAAWCDRLEPAGTILDRLEADALSCLRATAARLDGLQPA